MERRRVNQKPQSEKGLSYEGVQRSGFETWVGQESGGLMHRISAHI